MTSSKGHLDNPNRWPDWETLILVQLQVLSARENSDSHICRAHSRDSGMHVGLSMCGLRDPVSSTERDRPVANGVREATNAAQERVTAAAGRCLICLHESIKARRAASEKRQPTGGRETEPGHSSWWPALGVSQMVSHHVLLFRSGAGHGIPVELLPI